VEGAYLAHSVYGYFNNGGGVCYVVRLGADGRGATAQPAQRLIPSKTGATTGQLQVTALPEAPANVVVEIAAASEGAPPAAEKKTDAKDKAEPKAEGAAPVDSVGASEARFTLILRAGEAQETFENVSLRRDDARFVETAVNQGRTKSRLVQVRLEGGDAA